MSDSPLFGSWLEQTAELQTNFFGRDYSALAEDPALLGDTVNLNAAELVWEIGEMMNEYPGHKTWVTDRTKIDREAFLGEAVDALHFFANLLTALGFTDEQLTAAYLVKMQVNRERMLSGKYDGVSDKCPICHRELAVDMDDDTIKWCSQHGAMPQMEQV